MLKYNSLRPLSPLYLQRINKKMPVQTRNAAYQLPGDTLQELRNDESPETNIFFQGESWRTSDNPLGATLPALDNGVGTVIDTSGRLRVKHHPYFKQDFLVVLGSGQSNMVGSGSGGDTTIPAGVFFWNGGGIVAANYTQFPFSGSESNNLLIHAAEILHKRTGKNILLLLVANGSTAIDEWLDVGNTDPNNMWNRINTFVPAGLAAAGCTYVDRVFWHQGESNSANTVSVLSLKIRQLRAQFFNYSWWGANTYMVCGEMVRDTDNTAAVSILAVQDAVRRDPYLALVESHDLAGEDLNDVHFTGASLKLLGYRYAKVGLHEHPTTFPTNPVLSVTGVTADEYGAVP